MRVLSQTEIDALLAKMLENPSVLPDSETQIKTSSETKIEDETREKQENK